MNQALTSTQDVEGLQIGDGILMTPTGAVITGEISFDNYCSSLQTCQAVANGALWTLGDLLLYGENRGEWGDMYSQALDLTQKSYSTLVQAVRLSKAYPPETRVQEVSWSHHREALAEKDSEKRHAILLQAAAEGLNREGVRELIVGTPPPKSRATTCPQCGHQWQ
jgi:hypothetical protein|tara:strand:+ start:4454 stop:4951 length:498 start_codon:yes stop_codon:yes gene_type:complete